MTEEESHTASSKDSTIASYIHPNAAEAGSVFPTTGLLSEENLPGYDLNDKMRILMPL